MLISEDQVKMLTAGLNPTAVSKRQGLSYVEGHWVIDRANEIFGFGGWQTSLVDLQVRDTCETPKGDRTQNKVFMTATLKLTVMTSLGTVVREDVGFGCGISYNSQGDCYELASKEAVTDAMKRCFRTFGNQFGNSLYQKDNPIHQGGADAKAAVDEEAAKKSLRKIVNKIAKATNNDALKAVISGCRDVAKELPQGMRDELNQVALARRAELKE
jgi:DNA repair and recombination protein RAD52